MSKISNLNEFRKQKAKQARRTQAETNRRMHGRTNTERSRDALQKAKLETKANGARLEAAPALAEDPPKVVD